MGIIKDTKQSYHNTKEFINRQRRNPKIGGKCAYDATGNGDGGLGNRHCKGKIRAGSMNTCGSAKCTQEATARLENM